MWLVVPSTCSPCAAAPADSIEACEWRSRLLARSAMSRSKRMPPKYWRAAWKKGGWTRRLFGRICEPLTAAHGVARWISSLVGTRANRSPLPVRDVAQMTLDTCGLTSPAFFVSSTGPVLSSKTCQGTCLSGCEKCDRSWKAWVTALRLRSSERRKSARLIGGSGCLSSLTPTKDDPGSARPTPTVAESETRTNCGGGQGRVGRERLMLAGAVLYWPTPTASENSNRTTRHAPSHGKTHGRTLAGEAMQWATPTVQNSNGNGYQYQPGTRKVTVILPGQAVAFRLGQPIKSDGPIGMVLNPRFVETLMGWPIEWTSCVSVEVASSPSKQLTPSTSCESVCANE